MSTYYFGKSGKLEKFGALELPKFKTETSTDWVINGMEVGWKNRQPQYYNYLYQTSTKHHAIVDAKVRYTYGSGWDIKNHNALSTVEQVELKGFLKKVERIKVTQRCILDRAIQGGFASEIIYDKAGKKIMPYHVDFGNVRESKAEYDKNGKELPKKYYYTSDWKSQNPKNNKDFTVFYPFDPSEEPDKNKRYLVYYKDYSPDLGVYPYPEYMGGVPYIKADAEVGNFVYNNVNNGFSSGYIFNFYNGDLSEPQRQQIEEQLRASKHGTENAGKPFVSFNNAGDKGVEVTPIQANGQDERYINLNNQIRDEIFTAHAMSPIILGMNGSGGWSDQSAEVLTVVESFKRSYAAPVQEPFNEFMNGVVEFNELKGEVYLKHLEAPKPQIDKDTLLWFNDKKLVADYYSIELPKETVTTTIVQEKQFTVDNLGINDDDYEVVYSEEYNFQSIEEAKERELSFRQIFATKIEDAVLGALTNNPDLKPKEIAEIIGKPLKDVNAAIKSLNSSGALDGKSVTPEGETELEEFKIVYKYVVRNDVPNVETSSRPFCKKYMQLSQNRSFTIEDIELLSIQEGRDVFALRGGWYHNPDTDKTTRYCRHVWKQSLIRLK